MPDNQSSNNQSFNNNANPNSAVNNPNVQQNSPIQVIKPELPQGGGSIKGMGETFSTNAFNGTASLSIQIPATACRGMQPSLSLHYSSGGGNGIFGMGWNLAIPAISRRINLGVPQYTQDDTFVFAGTDYLVPKDGGTSQKENYTVIRYLPRTEGSFMRIEQWIDANDTTGNNCFWKVSSPDGTINILGKSDTAKISDPNNTQHVFSWLLEESYDTKGNHIIYQYQKDSSESFDDPYEKQRSHAQAYPHLILYGNDQPIADSILLTNQDITSVTFHFALCFNYQKEILKTIDTNLYGNLETVKPTLRTDAFSDFRSGFELRTTRLGTDILLFHNFTELGNQPCLVNQLALTYKDYKVDISQSPIPQPAILEQAQTIGYKWKSESYTSASLPGIKLQFTDFDPLQTPPQNHLTLPKEIQNESYEFVDLYGDGIPGVLVFQTDKILYARVKRVFSKGRIEKNDLPDSVQDKDALWQKLLEQYIINADGKLQLTLNTLKTDEALFALLLGDNQATNQGTNNRPALISVLQKALELQVEYADVQTIILPKAEAKPIYKLMDVTGDGLLELVIFNTQGAGYYPLNEKGTLGTYQAFNINDREHTDRDKVLKSLLGDLYSAKYYEFQDITGNGHIDLLIVKANAEKIIYYPGLGATGFGTSIDVTWPKEVPLPGTEEKTGFVRFAQFCGEGRQLVHIKQNSIDCYPCLGGGNFGTKISLKQAPEFGNDFTTKRLHLADINGSGLEDIIYVNDDHVDFYFNASGTTFTKDSVKINLPDNTKHETIQFADIYGNGTACMIVSQTSTDKTGKTTLSSPLSYNLNPRGKAYLLQASENQMGARTLIGYTSSIYEMLRDKQQNINWITNLPFPVQLVTKVETIDEVSKTNYISSYKYHYGFYNAAEKQFNGFGRVDRLDSDPKPNQKTPAAQTMNLEQLAYYAPDLETRTWYLTGASGDTYQALIAAFAKEYWQGDAKANTNIALPAKFKYVIGDQPSDKADTLRAHATLEGSVLRTEIYGRDATPWENIPYSVSQTQFFVRQEQVKGIKTYGVFFSYATQQISYNYERNPQDPHISHTIVLEVDPYGHAIRTGQILYPRRADQIDAQKTTWDESLQPIIIEAQQKAYISYNELTLVNQDQADQPYLLGIPIAAKTFRLKQISPKADEGGYYTWSNLNQESKEALLNLSEEEEDIRTIPHARVLSWQRHYYYDPAKAETSKQALPLGEFTHQLLLCRTESIAIDKKTLGKVYGAMQVNPTKGTQTTADELNLLLTTGNDQGQGGYLTYTEKLADAFYWQPGGFQGYSDAATFYLPIFHCDPMNAIKQDNKTTYEYDPYHLLVTKVTDCRNNATENTHIDYNSLIAQQKIDANGNISEVLTDPLGRVIATSWYGTQAGQPIGFAPLAEYNQSHPAHTTDQVLAALTNCIQKAATYSFYNLESWAKNKVPVHYLSITARDFPSSGTTLTDPDALQISISYSDGAGRNIQAKTRFPVQGPAYIVKETKEITDSNVSIRWLTTGVVKYNTKGAIMQEYEPYFSDSPNCINLPIGASNLIFYDALGREVLKTTPKAWIKPTTQGTKKELASTFTKALSGYLSKAVNGKATSQPLNNKLYQLLFKTGEGYQFIPTPWYQLHYDANDTSKDSSYYKQVDKKTIELESQQTLPAIQEALVQAAKCYNTPHISYVDPRGNTVVSLQLFVDKVEEDVHIACYDSYGNTKKERDARLQALNIQKKLNTPDTEPEHNNFHRHYTPDGQCIGSRSNDGGTTWQLNDVRGNLLYIRDGRGYIETHTYDQLGRQITRSVQRASYVDASQASYKALVELKVYVDVIDAQEKEKAKTLQDLQGRNLIGHILFRLGQEGLCIMPSNAIQNNPLTTSHMVASEYRTASDWSKIEVEKIKALKTSLLTNQEITASEIQTYLKETIEGTIYHFTYSYNALGQEKTTTDPDGNTKHTHTYANGWLKEVVTAAGANYINTLKPGTESAVDQLNKIDTPGITSVTYNAHGQITSQKYRNGVFKQNDYHSCDKSLLRKRSGPSQAELVEALNYTYDLVGNITQKDDKTMPSKFYANAMITGIKTYTYDRLYRLKEAVGPEQQRMFKLQNTGQKNLYATPYVTNPQDHQAYAKYTESYAYDASGNMTSLSHGGSEPYTKTFQIQKDSNRLAQETVGGQTINFTYDAMGNQLGETNGATSRTWNCCGNIQNTLLVSRPDGNNDMEYYVYDADGNRTRKTWIAYTRTNERHTTVRYRDVIYLKGFTVRKAWTQTVAQAKADIPPTNVYEWHEKREGEANEAEWIWQYNIQGNLTEEMPNLIRYQLSTEVGSSHIELDQHAKVLDLQDYYPYGGTAILKGETAQSTDWKTYQYDGKETDRSDGLIYYGQRYYSTSQARWLSTDPAGTVDGLNIYTYVKNSPITKSDGNGTMSYDQQENNVIIKEGSVKRKLLKTYTDILNSNTVKITGRSYTQTEVNNRQDEGEEIEKLLSDATVDMIKMIETKLSTISHKVKDENNIKRPWYIKALDYGTDSIITLCSTAAQSIAKHYFSTTEGVAGTLARGIPGLFAGVINVLYTGVKSEYPKCIKILCSIAETVAQGLIYYGQFGYGKDEHDVPINSTLDQAAFYSGISIIAISCCVKIVARAKMETNKIKELEDISAKLFKIAQKMDAEKGVYVMKEDEVKELRLMLTYLNAM